MKNENQITVNMENLTEEEKNQLLKLVEKSNEQQPKKRWRAEDEEIYYSITGDGVIIEVVEDKDAYDSNRYQLGNYFKTEEGAEFELNKRLVYQQLKDYALEHNEMDIDWTDKYQAKWIIYYQTEKEYLQYEDLYTFYDIGQIYFTSEEIAREAVKAVGEDRIEKYLFGVE